MSRWLVKKDGRMFGPFSLEQIRRLAESGKIDDDTLVREGNSGPWEVAAHVPGLFSAEEGRLPGDPFTPGPFGAPGPLGGPDVEGGGLDQTADDGAPLDPVPGDPVPLDIDSLEAGSFDIEQSFAPPESMLDIDPPKVAPPVVRTTEMKTSSGRPTVESRSGSDTGSPELPAARAGRGQGPAGQAAIQNQGARVPASRVPASLEFERDDATRRRAIAGLLSLWPGAGHLYLGLQQLGFAIMGSVLTMYVVFWGGAALTVRLCINASASGKATDSMAGRLIADPSGSSVGMSLLIVLVIFFLTTPLFVHLGSVVHAIQSADN